MPEIHHIRARGTSNFRGRAAQRKVSASLRLSHYPFVPYMLR